MLPTDSSIVVTNRTAIDSSGRIGSLYDGYRDCIYGILNVKNEEKLFQSHKKVQCGIIHGNNDQIQNLFRLLNINEQLRLSILLKLTSNTGIASLIDYPHTTSEHTRLFCYSYVDRIQQLPDRIEDANAFIKPSTSDTKATHIISGIDWGMDFVIILQLPSDAETIVMIDHALKNVCNLLNKDDSTLTLDPVTENNLIKIIHTQVYSNIPDLDRVTTFRDVCRYIEQNKNSTINHPVSYTLRPIKWLNSYYTGEGTTFIPLPRELNDNIEHYVLQLRDYIRKIETSIDRNIPKRLCGYLKERLFSFQKQWSDMKKKYTDEIERLSKLVIDIRSGQVQIPTVDQALKKNEQILMKNSTSYLTQYLNDLDEKGKLITSLTEQKFLYYNVADYNIDKADNERTIEVKLVSNDQRDCILCSNDTLNKVKSGQLYDLRRDMVKEFKTTSNLRLIYADFSYCSFELQCMMRIPSNRYKSEQDKSKQKETTSFEELPAASTPSLKAQASLPPTVETQIFAPGPTKAEIPDLLSTKAQTHVSTATKAQIYASTQGKFQTSLLQFKEPKTFSPVTKTVQTSISTLAQTQICDPSSTEIHISPPLPTLLSDNQTINVLLLGETGVGKSTFINALANYLTFNTLQDAQRSQPIVLIPVSFLITVGDNFQEHTVKFGNIDVSKNEDFDHPGQSVTQQCKSYVFNLHHSDGKKLRIIDTPGFGDTRGIDQDDRNMEHILKYIKNLSYVNAICFLLKPNESRLNIFFRSCLTQLLSLLGQKIGRNIIFCFTNARATFYTAGDTAPLLKKMLASLPMDVVPFKKDNTFCFDNESFRYLVALQNGISFDDVERIEYETSWTKSVTDANRLIRYICNELTAHRV